MAGRIAGDLLILLAAGFTVRLAVVMTRRTRAVVLKKDYARVFCCQLIACGCFILLALDIRFGCFTAMGPGALKAIGWALRALVGLAAALFLFLIARITAGSFKRDRGAAPNAIVLGLALQNGVPTGDLLSRLDVAQAYLRDEPDGTLILTGGNPDGAGRTEAAVMRDILAARGVAAERMILEDRAQTTRENFKNVAEMIDPGAPVALISSDYHMDRAVRTAKRAGFADVRRLPAPSPRANFGVNVIWEMVLELEAMVSGR